MLRPALLVSLPSLLLAQAAKPAEPAKRSWTDVLTLSFVGSSGNAEGEAFGFTNAFTWTKDQLLLTANLGATRAASTVTERKAQSNTLPYVLYTERDVTTVTAEQYYGNGRLDWKFADAWYWYGGGGWERNRPAGIESRTSAATGLGRLWIDTARTRFKTDLGVGNTWEEGVFEPPDFKDSYGTAVFSAALKQAFGASTTFTAEATATSELSDSENWYAVARLGLAASMSRHLALKFGVDVTHRNMPSRIQVPVYSFVNPGQQVGTYLTDAEKTDVVYTAGLVVTF
jgi:putative salt-induced outer membrane protein YdiY